MQKYFDKLALHMNTVIIVVITCCGAVITVCGLYYGLKGSIDSLTQAFITYVKTVDSQIVDHNGRLARLEDLHFGK